MRQCPHCLGVYKLVRCVCAVRVCCVCVCTDCILCSIAGGGAVGSKASDQEGLGVVYAGALCVCAVCVFVCMCISCALTVYDCVPLQEE